jgi:hypothetical protein
MPWKGNIQQKPAPTSFLRANLGQLGAILWQLGANLGPLLPLLALLYQLGACFHALEGQPPAAACINEH